MSIFKQSFIDRVKERVKSNFTYSDDVIEEYMDSGQTLIQLKNDDVQLWLHHASESSIHQFVLDAHKAINDMADEITDKRNWMVRIKKHLKNTRIRSPFYQKEKLHV